MYPAKPDAHAALLRNIRTLLAVIVGIHVSLFVIALVILYYATEMVLYYRSYLADPLSGPRLASTTLTAMAIVTDVHNVTATAAAAASMAGAAMSLQEQHRRHLMTAAPPLVQQSAKDRVDDALAELLESLRVKVDESDARAPTDFLRYLMAVPWSQKVAPYVQEGLAVAKYGSAMSGTLFAALGTPVLPSLVGPALFKPEPTPPVLAADQPAA